MERGKHVASKPQMQKTLRVGQIRWKVRLSKMRAEAEIMPTSKNVGNPITEVGKGQREENVRQKEEKTFSSLVNTFSSLCLSLFEAERSHAFELIRELHQRNDTQVGGREKQSGEDKDGGKGEGVASGGSGKGVGSGCGGDVVYRCKPTEARLYLRPFKTLLSSQC